MWLVLTHSCVIPGYGGDTDGLWDRNWHPAPGRRTDTSGSRPSQHQPRLALAGKMKSERKKLDPSSVTTYISHNLVPKAFPSNLWRKNPENEITYRKLGFFSPLINTDAFCRRSKRNLETTKLSEMSRDARDEERWHLSYSTDVVMLSPRTVIGSFSRPYSTVRYAEIYSYFCCPNVSIFIAECS